MTETPREEWIGRARATRLEAEATTRGIKLRKGGRNELVGPCPRCGGDDRFSINTKDQVFNCRGCNGKGRGAIDFVMFLDESNFMSATEKLAGPAPKANGHDRSSPPIKKGEWIYRDENDKAYLLVHRLERLIDGKKKKSYPQFHVEWHDGRPRWVEGKPPGPKIPYRLPQLLAAERAAPIWITEGEKCADAVAGLGLIATTASEGAGNWTAELNEFFRDRIVYILPDNDLPGTRHAEMVAQNLTGIANEVCVVTLPNLQLKEDIVEWIKRGGTKEKLEELGWGTPQWQPNGKGEDSGALIQDAGGLLRQEPQAVPEIDKLIGHFHGDANFEQEHDFMVYNTIPRIGGGLLAGQWGTYKTFLMNDLAAAIIVATIDDSQLFCDEEIDRPGGVLVYFSEGESEASIRIDAALDNRGWEKGRQAPYVYLTSNDLPLNLSKSDSVDAFIAKIKLHSAEMERRYGIPIVAVFIDTIGPVAGYAKSGDGNDEVPATTVNMALRRIGTETGTFCFGVEHFGKAKETGVLGSSVKEAIAYCILAALGDKDISGKVTDPKIAVRKAKGGIAGREYPFSVKVWNSGNLDQKGREKSTLRIEWQPQRHTGGPDNRKLSTNQKLAIQALAEVLLACGQPAPVELKLSEGIQVATTEQWRTELISKRVIDPNGKNPTSRFNEIRSALYERKKIGVRDDFVWLPKITAG